MSRGEIQFWEIPVFAAFLLFGLKPSILIGVFNAVILLLISPGVPFNEPVSNLLAVISTLLGLSLAESLITKMKKDRKNDTTPTKIFFSTVFGILVRLAVMMPYIYVISHLFGTHMIIVPLIPIVAIYDTIVVLYSVPIAYIILKAVKNQLKLDIA